MTTRLAHALEAAYTAGRSTLSRFQADLDVELKSDRTPVTVADREAEQIVRKYLAKHYPHESVLGEEEGLTGSGDDRWVVDPVDGTKSFICGVPLYATLLSYEVAGEPILGVAYFPALGEMVYAEKGEGAYLNGRKVRVSPQSDIQLSVIASGSHKAMADHGRTEGLDRLSFQTLATRTWGDAYGHGLVATGRVQAMLDPVVSRWDISAMVCIVEEAGGRCTRFDGSPVLHSRPDGRHEMVSSNGLLHQVVLEAFRV